MTFSFGRALQSSVLDTWKGKKENVEAAQKMLYDRCEASANAAKGKYEGGQGSTASDYVANYVYWDGWNPSGPELGLYPK